MVRVDGSAVGAGCVAGCEGGFVTCFRTVYALGGGLVVFAPGYMNGLGGWVGV